MLLGYFILLTVVTFAERLQYTLNGDGHNINLGTIAMFF